MDFERQKEYLADVSDSIEEVRLPVLDTIAAELAVFQHATSGKHYKQSIAWLRAGEINTSRLFVSRDLDGDIVAVSYCRVLHSRIRPFSTIVVPRGPIAVNITEFSRHLRALRSQLLGQYESISVSPFVADDLAQPYLKTLHEYSFRESPLQNDYACTLICRILGSQEAQWRTLRRSLRTSINRSIREGVEVVREYEEEAYEDFARNISLHSNDQSPGWASSRLLRGIWSEFPPADGIDSVLLSARWRDSLAGQILLLRNDDELIYELGWTDTQATAQRTPILHTLIWNAIGIGREHSIAKLDMGGFWDERDSSDPINFFKLGFTKDRRYYCPEHVSVLSKPRHLLRRALAVISLGFR